MNKLALKTFMYSIVALLSAVLFFLGSMVIFFPKVMSDSCATLGLDGLSAKCSEVVYKRDDSFENLLDLVAKSVYSGNETLIIRYSGKLLDEPRFYDYSESRYTDSGTKYYDFIAINIRRHYTIKGTNKRLSTLYLNTLSSSVSTIPSIRLSFARIKTKTKRLSKTFILNSNLLQSTKPSRKKNLNV